MNWLTLVALSAAGASGSVDSGNAVPVSPPAAVAPATGGSEAPAELGGVVTPRASGGFMQLKMDGLHLVIRFYDDQKKLVPVDVDRATVRLMFASRNPEQYTLAASDDHLSLTVGRPVRQPHVFRANIALFRGESESAVETYQLAYP